MASITPGSEWAKGQGIEIKDRGRVPASVVEQYKTAAGA